MNAEEWARDFMTTVPSMASVEGVIRAAIAEEREAIIGLIRSGVRTPYCYCPDKCCCEAEAIIDAIRARP